MRREDMRRQHKTGQHTSRQAATRQPTTSEDRPGQHEPPPTWGKFQKSGRREGKIPLFCRRCRLLLGDRMLKKKTLYQLIKFGHCKCILFTIPYKT